MAPYACWGALLAVITCIQPIVSTDCPDYWLAFKGSCYLFGHQMNSTFVEAEHYCRQHDAHLVHVDDATENAFLREELHRLKDDLDFGCETMIVLLSEPNYLYGANSVTFLVYSSDGAGQSRPPKTAEIFWIGLTDEMAEGNWEWYDTHDQPTFTDWGPGEPNNYEKNEDCATFRIVTDFHWNDYPCNNRYEPLCELRRTESEIIG